MRVLVVVTSNYKLEDGSRAGYFLPEVIDRMIANENRDENYELLVELCDTMEDASLCAMGGMTPYPVRSVLKYFAKDFASSDEAS